MSAFPCDRSKASLNILRVEAVNTDGKRKRRSEPSSKRSFCSGVLKDRCQSKEDLLKITTILVGGGVEDESIV